jgi:hypothetical protein
LPSSVLLLPCRKIKARSSRKPRGQGGGACSDSIWRKDPLDHFNMKPPNLSSTKSKNLENKIKNKLIFFSTLSMLLIRCMDIQGRGQREYQSEGGRSLPRYNWLRMSLNIGILKINSILTYLELKVNSFF